MSSVGKSLLSLEIYRSTRLVDRASNCRRMKIYRKETRAVNNCRWRNIHIFKPQFKHAIRKQLVSILVIIRMHKLKGFKVYSKLQSRVEVWRWENALKPPHQVEPQLNAFI